MDKHVLHNIIHRDANNNSADCPVCSGEMDMDDKKTLMSKAGDILQRKQSMGMSYSEDEKELLEFAELTSKTRNNLSDSDFAYIDPQGGRHLPIHDAGHVKNALARFNQTQFHSDSAKATAMSKVKAKAKEFGIDVNDKAANKNENDAPKKQMGELYTMVEAMKFAEGKQPPTSFKILPFGTFTTKYGKTVLNKENAQEMIQHYNDGLRAGGSETGIPIDLEHGDTQHKDAAAGWMKKFSIKADGLYCDEADWTDLGKQKLSSGEYKFISPEFYLNHYKDPETGQVYKNVITGAGLVNKPAFTHSLHKLVNGEKEDEKNLTNSEMPITLDIEPNKSSEKDAMDLHKIVAKEKAERTSEEEAYLNEHKGELTFDEAKKEGIAADAPVKTTDNGKVTMSEKEVKELQEKADAGFKASEKIRRMEIEKEVRKLLFTEKGLKLPTDQIEKTVDLLMTMSEDQAKIYKEQLEKLPDNQIFAEEGSDQDVPTDAQSAGLRFNQLVGTKRKEFAEKNAGKTMSYDEASKLVSAENPDLTKMMMGEEN